METFRKLPSAWMSSVMNPMPPRSAPRGFTLIELLITIGIIAVLASMLIPTIGVVRDLAKRADCASRLRQCGMAYQAYIGDNRGLIPDIRFPILPGGPYDDPANPNDTNINSGNPESFVAWYEVIANYVDQEDKRTVSLAVKSNVLRCPVYKAEANPWAMSSYNQRPFGYAANDRPLRNSSFTNDGSPQGVATWFTTNNTWDGMTGMWGAYDPQRKLWRSVRLSSVTNHAQRVLLMDSNATWIGVNPGFPLSWAPSTTDGWHFDGMVAPNDPAWQGIDPLTGKQWTASDAFFPRDRHRGKVNALFFDGHVGWYDARKGEGLDLMRAYCYPDITEVR